MSRKRGLSKETKELYTSLGRSVFLCFVALFAIVTATVAWFVSNSRVDSNVSSVSAEFEPVKLAVLSTDVRQASEIEVLNLGNGKEYQYEGKTYYYTDTDTIALRLDRDDCEVYPGAKGKIEFYVIPGEKSSDVILEVNIGAYGEESNNNHDALVTLMKGHILFFDNYDNVTYSEWLLKNTNGVYSNEIIVDLAGKKPGEPVKIDIYWIWPLRYANMKSYLDGSSFLDDQATRENMKDLNNGYMYSYVYLTNDTLNNDVKRSEAYDFADEYIGSNAQYLYLAVENGTVKRG